MPFPDDFQDYSTDNRSQRAIPIDPDGKYLPQLPFELVTGSGKGDGSSRLRVDSAQSSFFDKREFEVELVIESLGANEKQILRVISTGDFIVESLFLSVGSGGIQLTTWSGGTPTGSFSDIAIIPANTMAEGPVAPSQVVQVAATAAGNGIDLTGGTKVRTSRLITSNATAQRFSVGATNEDYVGRGEGTYYALFENIGSGTASGIFSMRWEERKQG